MPDAITRLNSALEGRYRIERELGEGGMATVYLADDLRHERRVALKVLKPELAAVVGAERFLAEIKTTANLQHPHILPLFDSGNAESFLFYVMPYVEGESLRERLDREHQLPVDEAVQIATNVAEALDYAHRQGVIHRDIKPANILLQDGKPVISDFGIALAVGAAGGGRLTETGLSLGTPHYMSPEQATGDLGVGGATDIYALGCVLYEMLVGEPPYTGSTPQAILGKIIAGEPASARKQRASVPMNVDGALRKALEKVPADRFRSAMSFAHAINDSSFRLATQASSGAQTVRMEAGPWRVATVASLLLAGAVAILHFTESRPTRDRLHLTIPLPRAGNSEGLWFQYGLSPDGRHLAVAGVIDSTAGTFVRSLDEPQWRLLDGSMPGDFTWSPDSRSLAFFDFQALKVVGVEGGPVQELTTLPAGDLFTASASWGAGDVIVLSPPSEGPLYRVGATGSELEILTTVQAGERHRWPSFLPDGNHFLFTSDGGTAPGVYVASLDEPEGRRLLPDVSSAVFVPTELRIGDGFLVFVRDDHLMAQPFDLEDLSLRGDALTVTDRVLLSQNGRASVSVSDSGILAYLGGGNRETDSRLVWFDRRGDRLGVEGEAHPVAPVSLSPDERAAVFVRREQSADFGDIWLRTLDRDQATPLTFDGSVPYFSNVIWSPDGRRIAFTSETAGTVGIYVANVSEPGSARLVLEGRQDKIITDWPVDDLLIFTERSPDSGSDVWYLRLGTDSTEPVPIRTDQFETSYGTVSPDGRWMAFVSDETGSFEVWVQPFPSGSGRWPVSSAGSSAGTTQQPRWTREGRELIYYAGAGGRGRLMAAPVLPSAGPNESPIGTPQPLFSVMVNAYAPVFGTYFYDVSSDGERFLVNGVDSGIEPELNVVLNWTDELRELVGRN